MTEAVRKFFQLKQIQKKQEHNLQLSNLAAIGLASKQKENQTVEKGDAEQSYSLADGSSPSLCWTDVEDMNNEEEAIGDFEKEIEILKKENCELKTVNDFLQKSLHKAKYECNGSKNDKKMAELDEANGSLRCENKQLKKKVAQLESKISKIENGANVRKAKVTNTIKNFVNSLEKLEDELIQTEIVNQVDYCITLAIFVINP